jgi:prephenate dehydratase
MQGSKDPGGESMKVAYQGEPGAFSERAVLAMFPDGEPLACDTIRLTFSRVTSGEADFGVVPVENSQAGSVNESYDLLLRSTLVKVVGEVVLRVDHALLAPAGARLEGIERAYSHWQALAQCEEFLTSHRIAPAPVPGSASRCSPSTSRRTPTTSPSSS